MNLLLTLALGLLLQLQPTDDVPKGYQGTFAITNARIETVAHGTIERGTVVIRGDRIEAVGTDVAIPAGAEVIDGTGMTVYPGMIDSGTHLGLAEIGAVDETNDYREVGDLNPQMEALTAVNPNSVLIPVTRVSGVTTVIAEPSGGLFPGVAALINLVGYTPEQMHAGGVRLMVLEFPTTGRRGFFDRRSDEEIEKAAEKALKKLNDIWDRAVLYAKIDSAYHAAKNPPRKPEHVPEMEALLPVVRGEMPLMIKVNREKDILNAIEWVKERGLKNVVFSEVAEGWRVADKLAEAGIPCLVGPVLSIPTRDSDRYDKAYANAGLMQQAGVKVALRTGEAENVRNLPFNAGFAAAYGMGREEALRAVTLNAAEIFGIAGDYGSIEPGKKANLFVADGDPFEPKTQVHHVFIDGFRIPMTNRQIELYREFLHRDEGRLQPVEVRPASN
ncbi:MAG: amidohydrolase [Rhodothermaceae bacterium]|nr:MAG: amidohydrolase [Rhodothermaceae bacterium]